MFSVAALLAAGSYVGAAEKTVLYQTYFGFLVDSLWGGIYETILLINWFVNSSKLPLKEISGAASNPIPPFFKITAAAGMAAIFPFFSRVAVSRRCTRGSANSAVPDFLPSGTSTRSGGVRVEVGNASR